MEKGLKQEDGSFIILKKDTLKELKPERTEQISLMQFVDSSSVAPIYYNHHYYVTPQKEADKAYFLLLAALAKYKQAAVGQFVLRDRDAVCLIQPYGDILLLSTLHYAYELLAVPSMKEAPRISSQELDLAQLLMKRLYQKEFDIADFHDTFVTRLKKALKQKGAGKPAKRKPKKEAPGSLMDALRASLEQPGRRS